MVKRVLFGVVAALLLPVSAIAEDKCGEWKLKIPGEAEERCFDNYGKFRAMAGMTELVTKFYEEAEQGDAQAQFSLGNSYENGRVVPQDYGKAAFWYQKAADQGHVTAMYALGFAYDNGRGLPQDRKMAAILYELAAKQGHWWGLHAVARAYAEGRGVLQNYAEAVKWYRKIDESSVAQYHLGVFYAEGRGVPQDYVLAHMWLNLAAAQGYEDGQRWRDQIANKMTPAQIAEAQRMAREWMEKHKQ